MHAHHWVHSKHHVRMKTGRGVACWTVFRGFHTCLLKRKHLQTGKMRTGPCSLQTPCRRALIGIHWLLLSTQAREIFAAFGGRCLTSTLSLPDPEMNSFLRQCGLQKSTQVAKDLEGPLCHLGSRKRASKIWSWQRRWRISKTINKNMNFAFGRVVVWQTLRDPD